MAKMKTIFDMVVSSELAAYWTERTKDLNADFGEELFPMQKHLGLKMEYIKGAGGIPVVINQSAFDANSTYRERIGMELVEAQMPYFKESMNINEVMRQQLNIMLETGNQSLIDSVLTKIFDDETTLLYAAKMQRERMRMMMLTTGVIDITSNGQNFNFDYGMPAENKVTVTKSWSDPEATIIDDIHAWMDDIEDREGIRPSRAVCSRKTIGYIMKNDAVRKNIHVMTGGVGPITTDKVIDYIFDQTGLEIFVYTARYAMKDPSNPKNKLMKKYIPDDIFVMFPEGNLGYTHMGTTPAESDLMTSKVANVSIVDTGVAITTVQKADPVNVDTIVSMICLPSFEQANYVMIADVIAE